MADVHSPEIRSKNMRAIRSANTKPEMLVRKELHALGFRYRLGGKGLTGRPDIVLPKYQAVVFVHGCFWHGHECKFFRLPLSRSDFWQKKIEGNRLRDKKVVEALTSAGWRVAVVHECAIRGSSKKVSNPVFKKLADWIKHSSETVLGLSGLDQMSVVD